MTVVVSAAYRNAPSYSGLVPAVEVVLRPKYGGGEYRETAVVDSGAEQNYVPYGVPAAYYWKPKGVQALTMNPVGGPKCTVQGFLVMVRLNAAEWTMPFYELPKGSALQSVLLGHELLRLVVVELRGPTSYLQVTLP
jgi:hypothetical protein